MALLVVFPFNQASEILQMIPGLCGRLGGYFRMLIVDEVEFEILQVFLEQVGLIFHEACFVCVRMRSNRGQGSPNPTGPDDRLGGGRREGEPTAGAVGGCWRCIHSRWPGRPAHRRWRWRL